MGQGVPSSGALSIGRAPPVAPGDILAGKYRVERVLGAGGMGVVVAATHIDLLERRAIKFMLAAQLGDHEAVERFLREARASSRLRGEHVARVHDVGRLENGAPYMVMEYLTGGDLRVLLKKRGAIPVYEAALYLLQACEALAEAHGLGIVHRDVKPENLFLTRRPDGTPSIKVLDFGISKQMGKGPDLALTSAEAVLGSPYYMSPEQLRASRDVDHRADIWSLGIILYQLVTNNLPFEGKNLTALIANVMFAAYPPASQVKLGLASTLDPVVARCLAKDAEGRYPSVAELAEDLLPLAPPAASQSVERILRLLRPNSASPSERMALSSYGPPDPPPPTPASTDPVPAVAPLIHPPGDTTYRSPGPIPEGLPHGHESGSHRTEGEMRSALGTSGPQVHSITDPSGGTLRSGGIVIQPARTPLVILAAGGAVALVIASLSLLFGRARPAEVTIVPSPPVTTGAAQPVPSTTPTATLAATMTVAPAALLPSVIASTTASTPATAVAPLPTGSGHHLSGKLPTKATAEPTKPPPSSGDPFGAGRQ
jgi:serine/threonine-protein kinase